MNITPSSFYTKKDNLGFSKSWKQIQGEISKLPEINESDKKALLKAYKDSCFVDTSVRITTLVFEQGIPALKKLANKGEELKNIVKKVLTDLLQSEDTLKSPDAPFLKGIYEKTLKEFK
ncbi:MAG: hypothetical protein PHC34_00015 [Candidatus Gastranaerophilales bacterium]|nr:hypothetical protein [Candidatus Gastranaerophilales bacterium]